jgi:hypothetical protein
MVQCARLGLVHIWGGLAAAGLIPVAWSGPAGAQPTTTLVYERTLMTVADTRCRLFTPEINTALQAGAEQARGAALRAGLPYEEVEGAETRAQLKALAIPCNNPDLITAAARVRQAFAGYAQLTRMNFKGEFDEWRAERPFPTRKEPRWALIQFAAGADGMPLKGLHIMLGLAGLAGQLQLTVVTDDPRAARAVTARLILRDPAKAHAPYADPRRHDLSARTPPLDLTQGFIASGRAPAGAQLLPMGTGTGTAFTFANAARLAMERLDPRDAVMVQIVYPQLNGERVQTGWVEVGDFRAGEAFLAVQRRLPTKKGLF